MRFMRHQAGKRGMRSITGSRPKSNWPPLANNQPDKTRASVPDPKRGPPHAKSPRSATAGDSMPEKETLDRARRDKRQGKAASTQAGEFVREEMHHIRQGKHGARSTKQAVAIGLSKARRAGVKLPPPRPG